MAILYKKIEGVVCDCEYPCSCDSPRYIQADTSDIVAAYWEILALDTQRLIKE